MKKTMKKIFLSNYFPFVIMFIVTLAIHLFINLGTGDDASFIKVLDKYNLLDWMIFRYNNWSSRNIIEGFMVVLLKLPGIIWRILDSIILTSIAFSISKLFNEKSNKEYRLLNWIIILLMLIYPFYKLNEAGWYATTLNYLWPVAFCLISFYPIKKIIKGENISIPEKIIYLITLLLACNQEQIACIVFCFYLIINIYLIVQKKASKYLILLNVVSLISLIYILSCPGNEVRTAIETATWFPEFSNFSLFDKLSLGIVSTIGIIATETRVLYILFTVLLCIKVFKTTEDKIKRFISILPVIITSALTIFSQTTLNIFPYLSTIIEKFQMKEPVINSMNCTSVSSYFPLLISFIFIIAVILSLYEIAKKEKKFLILIIFLAGIMSRIILGFSPTIFASGQRTFFVFDVAIIILNYCLYIEIIKNKNSKLKSVFSYILVVLTFLQIINTLIII